MNSTGNIRAINDWFQACMQENKVRKLLKLEPVYSFLKRVN